MLNNPWNVADASTFLKYCCPECDYQITELCIFENHATSDHEMSSILFENIRGTNVDINHTEKLQKDVEIPTIKIELKQELNGMLENDNDSIIESSVDNSDSEEDRKEQKVSSCKRDKNNVNASSKSKLEEFNISRGPELELKICDYNAKKKEPLRQEHNELPKLTSKFACHVCDFKTNHNSFLKKHILRQHGEYSHPCHICDFKTHLTTKLDKHLAEEHGISKYTGNLTCNLCDYKTNSNRNLGTHVLRIHGEYTQSCHICDFKTHLITKLDEHLLKKHDISKYSGKFACHVCDFKANAKSNLQKHTKKMHGERSQHLDHSCDICEFKANLISEVRKHLYDEHGISSYSGDQRKGLQQNKESDNEKKFLCHLCDFRTNYKKSLQGHLKIKHNEHVPKLTREKKDLKNCHLCDFKSKFNSNLRNHVARIHGNNPEFANSNFKQEAEEEHMEKLQSEKDFLEEGAENSDAKDTPRIKDEKKLDYHEKEIIVKNNGDGLCPHCGEYFKMLAQHILYKHETSKPWKCNLCDFSHASKYGLNAHKKRFHESENNMLSCHICSYAAKLKSNLKSHIRQVHDKMIVKCDICEKQFSNETTLKEHIKLSHLGKLLECKDCSEKFESRYRLSEHVKKVHKGIKHFCKICKKEFRDLQGVKRHILNIHEGIRFNCDECSKQFQTSADLQRHKLKIHSDMM